MLISLDSRAGINILQRYICGDAFHNSEMRYPPPRCHPNTRTVVQNALQSWAEAGHQAPGVTWLCGPAGTGKSALAQTMADRWASEGTLGAAFFAKWRVGGNSGKSLFPTIAYQLALHNPQLRNSIGLAVEADPAICDRALEEQARVLIIDPIRELEDVGARMPCLAIIDGLDECDGALMQRRIVEII
ncbi:hypothetical protein DFH06DRAFT_970873 [Mycena polygramma]|nr:hypothetical protein DFH06DRAFT_970873 [Mycena polygramma]